MSNKKFFVWRNKFHKCRAFPTANKRSFSLFFQHRFEIIKIIRNLCQASTAHAEYYKGERSHCILQINCSPTAFNKVQIWICNFKIPKTWTRQQNYSCCYHCDEHCISNEAKSTRVSTAADRAMRCRVSAHAKCSASHHMVIKPFLLLGLAAKYRSRWWVWSTVVRRPSEVYETHWRTKLTVPEIISRSRDMADAHQNLNGSCI